jgi:hypothetical protein
MFLVGLSMLALTSCEKDKEDKTPAKPVVEITEVGSHDGPEGQVTAGDELHLEAEITAEGLIAKIEVEIHQEEGGSFEIEETFGADSKYFGLKNAEFHEHIDIPAEAPAGEYHLHLTVTDQTGQTTTEEAELTVELSTDAPSIQGEFGVGMAYVKEDGTYGLAPVTQGGNLHLGANIIAKNTVIKIEVNIHRESGTPYWEKSWTYTYTADKPLSVAPEGYEGYYFHEHINPFPTDAPVGEYHVHLTITDDKGLVGAASADLEVVAP